MTDQEIVWSLLYKAVNDLVCDVHRLVWFTVIHKRIPCELLNLPPPPPPIKFSCPCPTA